MPVSEDKKKYATKLHKFIGEYKCIFLVNCDNVGSTQMQKIRMDLRGNKGGPQAEILFGKNTTIRKCMRDFVAKNEGHPIEALIEHVIGNVGLVFTNSEQVKVRDIILANKVPAPARIGGIAPIDVFVEPGSTGCDPGQTSFFQALGVSTKINKGMIDIISRLHLIKMGTKVTDSQAALCIKLNIRPFQYGLKIVSVYEAGSVFDVEVLDITEDTLATRFISGVSAFAAISLGLGLPSKATVVHSLNGAYKAILAIGLETGTSFPRLVAFEEALKNPGAFASAAPAGGAAPAAAAAAAAAPVAEKPKDDDDFVGGGGGLFGGDDDM